MTTDTTTTAAIGTDADTSELEAIAARVIELVDAEDARRDATVEANVRVSRDRHGLTRFANSFVHQHVNEDTRAVSLTVAVDGRTGSASTTALDDASLQALVTDAVEAAATSPVDPAWPGATPPAEVTGDAHFDPDTAAGDPSERAELVRAFVDAGPELRAAGFVDTQATWLAFASTAGHRAAGATTRATLDGIHQTERSAGGAHQTSVSLRELDAPAAGEVAAERARRSADFVDVEPGEFEVVLGPEAVATVLTFLGVYGFNAKAHLEGASFAKLGEAQFDEHVTLLDDPSEPRAIGLPFDAEGTPRARRPLIEQGVTRALAHDRRTAKRAGGDAVSTGGAVPGGEAFGAFPTNLVMPGGDTPPDTMVEQVTRGLLITQFHYVRILDPKSMVATGLTRNGTFLIEHGEVVGAVGNLRFTQSFTQALSAGRVLAVGDDDRYADGEFGAGMVICPSLRLAGWTFTGGAKG